MNKITASSLSRNSNRQVLDSIVKDQIKLIDAEILVAHTNGFNSVTHLLPTNFQTPHFDKADAQTYVYSEIVGVYTRAESNDGRGFKDVFLIQEGGRTSVKICWLNGLDSTERAQRRDILKKHLA